MCDDKFVGQKVCEKFVGFGVCFGTVTSCTACGDAREYMVQWDACGSTTSMAEAHMLTHRVEEENEEMPDSHEDEDEGEVVGQTVRKKFVGYRLSHTLLSCTSLTYSSHALLSYTPRIHSMHSSHTLPSYPLRIR